MDKANYMIKLYGFRDETKGEYVVLKMSTNIATAVRDVIPALNGTIPLNDIKVYDLGEINPFNGLIEPMKGTIVGYDWKECYEFKYESKATTGEAEAPKTEEMKKGE